MLRLIIKNESRKRVSKRIFEEIFENFQVVCVKKVREFMNSRVGEVGLMIVNDRAIHLLNKTYRRIDKATDVLSFAYGASEASSKKKMPTFGGQCLIGDVFVSIDTACKQAKERGHTTGREMQILFTHGLLHLIGFDHRNDQEEAKMEKWAGKILR